MVDKVEKWIAVSAEVKVVNLKDLRKLIYISMTTTVVSNSRTQIMLLLGDVTH